ncbi:MAG TPA: SMC family ATPase [Isosphaeraceae bacterium]|jgi:DNA repair exonuclease SbcCD ATPase subunit|nr:SMC family ATPase [Isosphaeraceae bacterium]
MIPRRIVLQGFLSYRDEQAFDLDGATIWMLAGPNGSGKSSVFDALTFALFGAHRGGLQDAEELIHKGCDVLRVEFDFQVGDARFRIQRSVRRKGRSTRQVYRLDPDGATWHPEPGTDGDRGFNAWIADHVGLSYKTFTSSVLLLQGGAERLISAPPTERLVVLKDIVGIDRFERLHRRVDDRRKGLAQRVEDLKRRLDSLGKVSDDELDAARVSVVEAEAARANARAEIDRLVSFEQQAALAAEYEGELARARQWCERARQALDDAQAIERDRDRLVELRAVIPHLADVVDQRQLLASADAETARLEADRVAIATEQERRGEEIAGIRATLGSLAATIAAAEGDAGRVARRLLDLAGPLARAALCEEQSRSIATLEGRLGNAPTDLEEQLDAARAEHDRLDDLRRALPALERFRDHRDRLRAALDSSRAHEAALVETAEAIRSLDADRAALDDRLSRATVVRQEAERLVTEARMARNQAIAGREELEVLAGSPRCDHCGQPLTPEHLDAERARRVALVAEASDRFRCATEAVEDARTAEATARAEHQRQQDRTAELRERDRTLRRDLKVAGREAESSRKECARALDDWPAPLRDRLAIGPEGDWAATTFPTDVDLERLRSEAATLVEARRHRDKIEKWHREWCDIRARLDSARQILAEHAAGLPADIDELRREQSALLDEDTGLKARLESARAEKAEGEAKAVRIERALIQSLEHLSRNAQESARLAGRRKGFAEALARSIAALPEPWRCRGEAIAAAEMVTLRAEARDLEARGVEARARELDEARTRLELQQDRAAELERQLGSIPPEARRDPAELKAELDRARRQWSALDARLRVAGEDLSKLEDLKNRRVILDAEARATELDLSTCARLADLLGPRGLQRQLVRRAERGILRFANHILDHLSGGLHELRARVEEDAEGKVEKALDLEVYSRSTRQTIAVAFLSGSQRFRVAVSLALGIGRYASRLHRPIESVIIDEGFGCLDREGRQVMIQELQSLREQVRRIILVSHQEEFADAFPAGYRLEMRDGTTVATPLS